MHFDGPRGLERFWTLSVNGAQRAIRRSHSRPRRLKGLRRSPLDIGREPGAAVLKPGHQIFLLCCDLFWHLGYFLSDDATKPPPDSMVWRSRAEPHQASLHILVIALYLRLISRAFQVCILVRSVGVVLFMFVSWRTCNHTDDMRQHVTSPSMEVLTHN